MGGRCEGSAFVEQRRTSVQFPSLFQTPVGKARLPLRTHQHYFVGSCKP